jgi:hypothetical protein
LRKLFRDDELSSYYDAYLGFNADVDNTCFGGIPWSEPDVKDVMIFKLREYLDQYMFECPLAMAPDYLYSTLLGKFDITDFALS